MKNWMYCAALALLLAGCTKDNPESYIEPTPPDQVVADRVPSVPFSASYETRPKIVVPPPFLGLEIPGKGKGLHLGKSTWFSNSTVDVTVFPFQQTGTMTFTAADGSTLAGHFAGTAVPVPDPHHRVNFNGEYWITSGTGRFNGATGTGTYSGEAALDDLNPGTTGTGNLGFEGVLNRP